MQEQSTQPLTDSSATPLAPIDAEQSAASAQAMATETHDGVMARWTNASKAVRTSIDPKQPRGRAMISKCMAAADKKIRNAVGDVHDIVDYFAHVVELADVQTGEVGMRIRLVLVKANGQTISTFSKACIEAFGFLAQFMGPGPWSPPMRIMIREQPGSNGHTYCELQEVMPEADPEHAQSPPQKKK